MIEALEKDEGRKLKPEEISLALEQARALGEIDDTTEEDDGLEDKVPEAG